MAGSAGAGKTIVALRRAIHLARSNLDARVLLTTFSDALASALQVRLNRLVTGEPRLAERIDVYTLTAIAIRLHKMLTGPVNLVGTDDIGELLHEASDRVEERKFSDSFLRAEWTHAVDAWQLQNTEEQIAY